MVVAMVAAMVVAMVVQMAEGSVEDAAHAEPLPSRLMHRLQQRGLTRVEDMVALFKGATWRDNPGSGVVHRSPPVSPGQQRLLVTLDI